MEWEPIEASGTGNRRFIRPSIHAFAFSRPLFESDSEFDFDSNKKAYETRKAEGQGRFHGESDSELEEAEMPDLPLT